MQQVMDDRSLGELFDDLRDQAKSLISQEVRLAKAELGEKGAQAGKAVGFLAVGGFVVYAGFLAIIAAITLVLGQVVPIWVAALVVGVIVALIGYLVIQKGLNDLKEGWTKHKMRSVCRHALSAANSGVQLQRHLT